MSSPWVYLNGKFVKLQDARVSILDRGFTYGDGLFETMRAYGGKIFRLDLHLDRLERSADLIYLDLPLSRQQLSEIVTSTLQKNRLKDAVIRLTITRGSGLPGLGLERTETPTVVVYAQLANKVPEMHYRNGVAISMFSDTAARISGLKNQVKSNNYLSAIIVKEKATRAGSIEGIMLKGKDRVTEGTVSNIFIVKDGILKTPALGAYVLSGVTRQVIIEIADRLKILQSETLVRREDIYEADEVFLTNTGIEVLPVTQADGKIIANGKPGKLTKKLHRAYLKIVEAF